MDERVRARETALRWAGEGVVRMGWWAWAVAAGHITTAAVWVLAVAWFALCCAVLVRTDLREHRLPNRWTLRLALGGLVGMAGGAALAGGQGGGKRVRQSRHALIVSFRADVCGDGSQGSGWDGRGMLG